MAQIWMILRIEHAFQETVKLIVVYSQISQSSIISQSSRFDQVNVVIVQQESEHVRESGKYMSPNYFQIVEGQIYYLNARNSRK